MAFNVNNSDSQFEWQTPEGTGILEYSRKEGDIYLTHTEVPEKLQGKGIGTKLVRQSLDYVRSHNLTVMPLCSFVRNFIDNHPEYHDLLSEGYRM